jgi:hypothetical protein
MSSFLVQEAWRFHSRVIVLRGSTLKSASVLPRKVYLPLNVPNWNTHPEILSR